MDNILLQKTLFTQLYIKCPVDTGNLRASLRFTMYPNGDLGIKCGFDFRAMKNNGNSKRATYMPYTNEKWNSPRFKGRSNPNYHWWNRTIEMVMNSYKVPTNSIIYTSKGV